MKIEKGVEKIVLTEQEARTLEKAYEIVMNIRDKSETIASTYAEAVTDALIDLIVENENDDPEYTIGCEKTVDKKVIFVAVEI